MRYAGVVVDLSVKAVDKEYTYIVPDELDIVPGDMVLVPFGKKYLEGFVTGIK
ncbi:MAG: hypothetical protein IK056_09355, partial [Clostridia bacterium]|nr:hypothetical protein [Clostridia bacterium]